MDEFNIPIVWECIAQNERIEREDVEEDTGLNVLELLAIIQKFKYYDLIVVEKEGVFNYLSINKNLSIYQVSRANNLGINMDLLKKYCFLSLKDDYDILKHSLEFDDLDDEKKKDIKSKLKVQRKKQKMEQLKDSKKDLINLLGITEDLINSDKSENGNDSIKLMNEKLNKIFNKMVD